MRAFFVIVEAAGGDLGGWSDAEAPGLPSPRRQEREYLSWVITACGGNKSEAAALLGIGRTTLYRRLRQLGLDGGEDSL